MLKVLEKINYKVGEYVNPIYLYTQLIIVAGRIDLKRIFGLINIVIHYFML